MSGHSKWANIKHRKSKQDATKGKVFTKLIRELTVAAKSGTDQSLNSQLRLAIDHALSNNMSRDTIERAIKKGSGNNNDAQMDAILYEGYGPGGVAILVSCLTDNRNRTAGDVRYVFSKNGGSLGTNGSVSYLFKQMGFFCFSPGIDENKIMQVALDFEAEDIKNNEDGSIDLYAQVSKFTKLADALTKAGLKPEISELTMIANTTIDINQETNDKITKLLDELEDLDDVQQVYTNANL